MLNSAFSGTFNDAKVQTLELSFYWLEPPYWVTLLLAAWQWEELNSNYLKSGPLSAGLSVWDYDCLPNAYCTAIVTALFIMMYSASQQLTKQTSTKQTCNTLLYSSSVPRTSGG